MKTIYLTIFMCIIAQFVNSQSNYSLKFDGVDDKVTTPKWMTDSSTTFTYEAYIKPDSIQGDQCAFLAHNAFANDVVLEFRTAPLRIHGQIYKPGNYTQYNVYYPISPNSQTWYHVAMTYDGNYLRLLVNGNVVDSVAGNNYVNWDANYSSSTIGARTTSLFYKGSIDEVRIWSIARTNAQIKAYKDSCLLGNNPGLVGYWQFNEGAGTTTADITINAFNGTLVNGVTWDTDFPFTCVYTSVADITSKDNQVNAFPNPFNNLCTITFLNSQKDNYTLLLYNVQGHLIRTINNITDNKVIITRQNLSSGLYFYRLLTDNKINATGKLIIE